MGNPRIDAAVDRARWVENALRQRRRDEAAVQSDPSAASFRGLSRYTLGLDHFREANGASDHVNLLVPDARPSAMFAGVYTALAAAVEVARQLDLPLRIVSYLTLRPAEAAEATSRVTQDFDWPYERLDVTDLRGLTQRKRGQGDVWIATHSLTAHTLQTLSTRGRLDAGQVIYLIQDYEPSFYAASTDQALASATYHAGFRPLVNSAPLASSLELYENVTIEPATVFAPQLDFPRLAAAAARREPTEPRVLFYGRPGKGRNMFDLGLAALREAVRLMPEPLRARTDFVSMGAAFTPIDLGKGRTLTSVGRLGWDAYFERLISGQVILSLQATPHPSHPPLDMVAAGGWAVTNELGGIRDGLHERLMAVSPGPTFLGQAIVESLQAALGRPIPAGDDTFVAALGGSLATAVAAVTAPISKTV